MEHEFFVIREHNDILAREDGTMSNDDGVVESDREDDVEEGEYISDQEIQPDEIVNVANLTVVEPVVDNRVSF